MYLYDFFFFSDKPLIKDAPPALPVQLSSGNKICPDLYLHFFTKNVLFTFLQVFQICPNLPWTPTSKLYSKCSNKQPRHNLPRGQPRFLWIPKETQLTIWQARTIQGVQREPPRGYPMGSLLEQFKAQRNQAGRGIDESYTYWKCWDLGTYTSPNQF